MHIAGARGTDCNNRQTRLLDHGSTICGEGWLGLLPLFLLALMIIDLGRKQAASHGNCTARPHISKIAAHKITRGDVKNCTVSLSVLHPAGTWDLAGS